MGGSIRFDNVGLCFRLHRERVTTLKEAVLGRFRHLSSTEDFWALQGISFEVKPGEAVGLIGHNGSGKSTLLRVTAGVLHPSEGTVEVTGRVAPMIELGAGFDPELSGRDNVFLCGALLGYTRKQMADKYDRIAAFTELGDMIDLPIKNYSSGMYARLGFAIATDVDPDILIIDEILAVGDERFQQKCNERMETIRSNGCTILYVSHSMDAVRKLCTRVVALHHGHVAFDGEPDAAIQKYRELQGFVAVAS